jgi:hypothetical protein
MIKPIKVQCLAVVRTTVMNTRTDTESALQKGNTVETETVQIGATAAVDSASYPLERSGQKSEVMEAFNLRFEGEEMGRFKVGKFYDLVFQET